MNRHEHSLSSVLLLAGLLLGTAAAGCGSDKPAQGATAAAKTTTARPAHVDVGSFLMRKDEQPGFRPGAGPDQMPRSRQTITGVNAFAKEMGLAPADARRLRNEGFISFTAQPIRGPRETAGVSTVILYETADGAKRGMAHDLRPDVIRGFGPVENLRFFTVKGVPGARGWTATLGEADHKVGNVFWVQGRCVLGLGNQGPGPFAGPLSAGVRAIYQRTKGQCP